MSGQLKLLRIYAAGTATFLVNTTTFIYLQRRRLLTIEASLLFDVEKVENQKNCDVSVCTQGMSLEHLHAKKAPKKKNASLHIWRPKPHGCNNLVGAKFVIDRVHNIKN